MATSIIKHPENKLSSGIDISSYTTSDKYVCPSDGYLYLAAKGTDSFIYILIYGASGGPFGIGAISDPSHTSRWVANAISVRRGMKIAVSQSTGDTIASFWGLY